MKYKKLLIFLTIIVLLAAAFFATSPYRKNLAANYVKVGDQLFEQKNYSKSVIEYRKARLLNLRNPNICFKIANNYKILENYKFAYSYYNKAIKLDKQNQEYYLALANSYWEQEDLNNAIFTLKEGLTKISNNNDKKNLNILLGQIYLDKGEKNKAKSAFESSKSLFWEGIYWAWDENYEKALEFFQKSNEENAMLMAQTCQKILKTANPASQKVIFAQMLNQIGSARLALPILKNITSNYPDYRDAWIFLGYSYLEIQKYQEAENALNSALNLDPIYPLTYELLAKTYEGKGDFQKAKENRQKAEELK